MIDNLQTPKHKTNQDTRVLPLRFIISFMIQQFTKKTLKKEFLVLNNFEKNSMWVARPY